MAARLGVVISAILAFACLAPAVAAADPVVSLTMSVSPTTALDGADVTWTGVVTPVSGTPTNLRLTMESHWWEISVGPYQVVALGTCEPVAYCTVDTSTGDPTWMFPTLTEPVTLQYHTLARGGATTALWVVSDGVGCVSYCPPTATLEAPYATADVVVVPSASQILPGTTLHVTITGAVTMGPFDGEIVTSLSDGLGAPTALSPASLFIFPPPDNRIRYAGPITGSSISFDTVVTATYGSTLTIESSVYIDNYTSSYTSVPGKVTIVVGSEPAPAPAPAPPSTTGPTKSLVTGTALSSGKPLVRFSWTGNSVASTVDHYELALSTDGGPYRTVASPLASPSLTRALATGHSYRARARAVDAIGNIGAWAYGTGFKLSAYQESSSAIHWTGTWHTSSSTSYWGGRDRYSSAAGAKASLTFTGRSFAWVGSVGPTRGYAKVYVNGLLVKTINLGAANNANRRILYTASWSTAKSRTVTIRISGTAGHPRGDVDALITAS